MAWHLYVIETQSNTFYAGITTQVARRFKEHKEAGAKCARYLRAHPPRRLAYSRRIGTHSLALKVEYRFKQLPRVKKIEIVKKKRLRFNKESGHILT